VSLIDTDALVLDSHPYKDRHLILALLSPTAGLFRAVLRGARGGKNPSAGATQLLSLVHVVAFQSRHAEMATVRQVDLRTSSYDLASDLDRASSAAVVAELLTTFCPPGEPAPRRFRLGIAALNALLGGTPPATAVAYCQFWCLVLGGVLPPVAESGLDEDGLDFLLAVRSQPLLEVTDKPTQEVVNWLDQTVRAESDRPLRALDFLRSIPA
jgi:DNA repair protein RecO